MPSFWAMPWVLVFGLFGPEPLLTQSGLVIRRDLQWHLQVTNRFSHDSKIKNSGNDLPNMYLGLLGRDRHMGLCSREIIEWLCFNLLWEKG
jgi:hypothetical protein